MAENEKLRLRPATEPGNQDRSERRNEVARLGNTTAVNRKTPAFPVLSEFSAATSLLGSCNRRLTTEIPDKMTQRLEKRSLESAQSPRAGSLSSRTPTTYEYS